MEEVEEYLDLVPPERLPRKRAPRPAVSPHSKVTILLERTGCFGSCPAYTSKVSTGGITFNGRAYVVAAGEHLDTIDPDEVLNLARQFVAAREKGGDRMKALLEAIQKANRQ